MTALATSVRRDSLVIGLIGAAHFMSHFFQLALAPIFPLLKDEFDVSWTALGGITAVFYAVSGVCQALVGVWCDRYGAARMLYMGLALLALSIAAAGVVPYFWMLYPLAALAGMGNSVFHPADLSILSTRVSHGRLGRAYSVHGLSGTLGYATSPVVIGTMAFTIGWRPALIVAGVLGLVSLAMISRFDEALGGRDKQAGSAREDHAYGALIRQPRIVSGFVFFALAAMAGIGFQSFGVPALISINQVPLAVAATGLTVYLLAQASGIFAGGWIVDWTRRHDLVAITGMGLAAATMAVVGVSSLPFTSVLVLIAFSGFSAGTVGPARDMLIRAAAPEGATGKVFGFVYSGLDIGSCVGPLWFGWLMDHDAPRLVFAAIAVTLVLTLPMVITVRRSAKAVPAPAD
ncbi:MAG: MFS transporter [Alphaproteobacteria bacterium]|nr:MFS transporter [Alphaproteobacteria bacterium]